MNIRKIEQAIACPYKAMTRIPLAQLGEEGQIFSGDRTVARLIAETHPLREPRKPGSAIGTLTILSED